MLDPFAHRKILNRGQPARATVLAISTPANRARASQVAMTLEIQPPSGPPYEVSDRWAVAGTEPIIEGTELRVVIDPGDRRRVAIDWERSHSGYRERTEVRRRVMAGGIPRPVSAVREAIDERLPTATPKVGVAPAASAQPAPADDMINRLERLAALHRSGALTAGEFAAAKRHVLGLG
jgi:hypothetical protein